MGPIPRSPVGVLPVGDFRKALWLREFSATVMQRFVATKKSVLRLAWWAQAFIRFHGSRREKGRPGAEGRKAMERREEKLFEWK